MGKKKEKASVRNSDKTLKSNDKRLANLKPWKPGQCPNPGGRPKGKSITAQINKLIAEGYKGKDVAEALAKRALDLALAGDVSFWREFVERHEGKIRDTLDLNVITQYDFSKLTPEELAKFVELSDKARVTE